MHFADHLQREAEAARAFLKANTMAAVSTASNGGEPQVAFVYYVIDEDFNFFFLTRRDSRKFLHIMENARVAVAVANEDELQTVQMTGKAEEVTDEGEIARHTHMIIRSPKLSSLYMSNTPMKFLPPRVPEPDGTHYVLVRLKPEWIRWMRKNLNTLEPEFFTLLGSQ